MDLENALYRIINGYYNIFIDDSIYKIILPDIHTKQTAHSLYLKTIDDYKFDISSWQSKSNIDNLLRLHGLWNDSLEDKLQEIINNLDQVKIQLFLNFAHLDSRLALKKLIEDINININEMYNKKHYFDYLTLEYYAQNIKHQYLITNMIYTSDNKKLFDQDTFDNIDAVFLEKILFQIQKNSLEMPVIKALARNEIWRSYWNISRERIFGASSKDWTDEQRSLVNFTKTIDSIREHIEPPTEDIIADDDALDGWILYQNDKTEKEKKRKHIENKFGLKNKKGSEIFLLSNNEEEVKEIYSLNDIQTNKDIQNMIKVTQTKGSVQWSELPHVQRDIKQQIATRRK